MMNNERISVIIPVYNAAPYLEKCVDSVLAQTCSAHEIILIDDGSTDASGAICDRYVVQYPELVQVIHQMNRGAAAARNAGIATATGDYYAFVDSDDYLEPEMLRATINLIHKYDADMAAAERWVEYASGERYCRQAEPVEACWNTEEALVWLNSYRYLYTGLPSSLVSRKAFGDLRFPEGARCEDFALQYQIIARCRKIAYTSAPLYHYVQTDESCSRTANICLAPMDISMEQLEFFKAHFPDIVFAAETCCAFEHMGIWTAYLRNGVPCPRPLLRKLRGVTRRYLKSVLRNRYIPGIKKLQAIAFCYAPPVYKRIIVRTKHR